MPPESTEKRFIDIALSKDPKQKVKAVIAMLYSSAQYERVLEYAGLDGETLSQEEEQEIRALVEEANAQKNADQPADRRAVLPSPPHGSIPKQRTEAVEALGVDARSVYRDLFLNIRMRSAFHDARGPRAGIFSYHLFPVEMLESALQGREAANIQDGITRRLRELIPQLKEMEREIEQQRQSQPEQK